MKNKPKKLVFVGLSGGVDSSVSAARLLEQGYEVVGVFIKVWQPDFIECTWRKERQDAMRICAKLDIPFLSFDFEDIYKKHVADYMISEYKMGRVPNPDVMCNKSVKFGAFLDKAISMGADFVATGHYAQNKFLNGTYHLIAGDDISKDQSYFLWTLGQEQLKHVLFPVGDLKKPAVRKLAKKYGLHTHDKKDSQGICFLGKLDMKDFLKHYIKSKKGNVLLADKETCPNGLLSGRVIGSHDGAMFYALGERHGFMISKKTPTDKPYYVITKDIKKNTLTVSQNRQALETSKKTDLEIKIENTNWILGAPNKDEKYSCQIRYHGELLPCKIEVKNNNESIIYLDSFEPTISSGQSIVVYNGKICLGGGVVV